MTAEERSTFKLKANFGGPSQCLYHRTIRKIYGRDAGAEVIQALQDCPSVSVPVVLARLKQKDDEWRRISFKQNDKKAITAKYFVADIESLKAQQIEAQKNVEVPAFTRGSVGYFGSTRLTQDGVFVPGSFPRHLHPQERRGAEKFLRSFVPLLCRYPAAEFNEACGPLDGATDDDNSSHDLSGPGNPTGTRKPILLLTRKKLLKSAQEKISGRDSKGSSPLGLVLRRPQLRLWHLERMMNSKLCWVITPKMFGSERPRVAHKLLYSRLLTCKLIGVQLAAEKHRPLLANPVAAGLGLDDPNGPSAVLAQAMEAVGEQGVAEGSNVVYMYLLDACEKVFDGELDQSTFEEHMRWFFGNKAYHVFTLDKLITALVKQVHTILSDNKCQELWTLLQYMQTADALTNRDIVRYRREAERHVGQDDHLYKIKWEPELKMLRIQLIGADDPSVDGVHRWSIDGENTLTRISELPKRRPPTALVGQYTHRLPTYKLMYEFGTEDCLVHAWCAEEQATLRERARARHEERKRCHWLQQ
ncbi:Transcriptional regulatory protein [Salix suchowensis]|nr:Transcriptional regulatory protein [Salix suchowensis]